MHVETCIELCRRARTADQSLIAQCEGCVQAEESTHHAVSRLFAILKEGTVFVDALVRDLGAVAIRDLVAEATAQSCQARSISDAEQAAGDRTGTGVMIEDGGGAISDAVNHCHHGAQVHIFESQNFIQPPPEPLKNLNKVARRIVFQRHSTSKRAVEMHMCIDEAGHDEPAPGIDKSLGGVGLKQCGGRADLNDLAIANGDATVFDQRQSLVVGDEVAVANQQDCGLLHCAMDSSQIRGLSIVIQITLAPALTAGQSMNAAAAYGFVWNPPQERPD